MKTFTILFVLVSILTGRKDVVPGVLVGTKPDPNLTIELRWSNRVWKTSPEKLGVTYDTEKGIAEALKIGREGSLVNRWRTIANAIQGKISLPLEWEWNDKLAYELVAEISDNIDSPASEPEVVVDKKNISVLTGENGQETDKRLLMEKIRQTVSYPTITTVDIPVIERKPKLSDQQADIAKKRVQKLIGKKIELGSRQVDQVWALDVYEFAAWINPVGGWKKEKVMSWVDQLAGTVNRPAQNAMIRYIASGKVEEFVPERLGVRLINQELVEQLITELASLEGTEATVYKIQIPLEITEPNIKTADINNLGIRERVGRGESWFSGSITNRIYNLKKATAILNGVLIAPGDVFSFNKSVGEISAATGYKQAYIIKEGKTILGDGGGVCQVSSTLFRAVLNAGLPITARTAHAYRVHYYEEKYSPGFDATVFQPAPDFRFVNDTPGYILIQTSIDEKNKHLVFDLYGTKDGRVAEISKAKIWDQTPPPPDLYQDDPTLPIGKIVQTEHSSWGAKVAFDWKVVRGSEILQQRTFYSNYQPWQAVFLRGTKI